MYGVSTYIYHKNQLNVAKYTIHGSYGSQDPPFFTQVWSFGPVGPGSKSESMVLPRAAQSLEALYRDLQAHKLDYFRGHDTVDGNQKGW